MNWEAKIFQNHSNSSFEKLSLEIFLFQAKNNPVYKTYLRFLGKSPDEIKQINQIPYLPIELFKQETVVCEPSNIDAVFTSSGTGGTQSKHIVHDIGIYEKSFASGFEHFYGNIKDYTVLALLPSYLQSKTSINRLN